MVKPGLYNCFFGGGTNQFTTTSTVHRPFSSKPIIYKTIRLTFFPSHKVSKWIWDFHVYHTSIISENSGEVNKNRITPITHNTLYKTLSLGYARYARYEGLNLCATIWFDNENMHNMDPG